MKIPQKTGFILCFQFTCHWCSTRERTFSPATKARTDCSSYASLYLPGSTYWSF